MKIILLGDSITQGIGSKKINYANKLEELIPMSRVENLGFTGTTIKYAKTQISQIKEIKPDVIVIFYGNVDAMPRVKTNCKLNIYKILPKRYKLNGMLNPRALYTSKKPLRYIQKIDSFTRTTINKVLINTQGYEQWVELNDFNLEYRDFIDTIKDYVGKIILLSTVPMYDKWFPYANKEYQEYNRCIENIALEYGGEFIDIYSELSKYEKKEVFLEDKFHLNKSGYDLIAQMIFNKIQEKDAFNEK